MTDVYRLAAVSGLLLSVAAGCLDPAMFKSQPQSKPKETSGQAAPAAAPAAAAPSFPQDNTQLYDKKKLMAENPALVETENHIRATDPLSAAGQAYFAIGSQAQVLALEHSINLYKAEHDKPPTFAEFEGMIRQNGVKLKGLYRWQVYAYDQSTGELSILEDRDMKKREYEKAGLKFEG
jgi:hypothetical protein